MGPGPRFGGFTSASHEVRMTFWTRFFSGVKIEILSGHVRFGIGPKAFFCVLFFGAFLQALAF